MKISQTCKILIALNLKKNFVLRYKQLNYAMQNAVQCCSYIACDIALIFAIVQNSNGGKPIYSLMIF